MKCFPKALLHPRRSLFLPSLTAPKSKLRISYVNDIIRKSFSSGSGGEDSERTSLRIIPDECGVAESLSDITEKHEWVLLQIEEPLPSPRSKHAALGIGRRVFVVGGTSVDGLLGDVQVFNTQKLLWTQIWPAGPESLKLSTEIEGPGTNSHATSPGFTGHFVGAWKKKLIVVGSSSTDQKNSSLTVHAFDLLVGTWSTLRPRGEKPAACIGQRIVHVGSALVMFGGEDSSGRILDDLCILDLEKLVWVSLQTTGAKPAPRKYHAAACYGGRYLWIYGGKSYATYYNDVYSLDLTTLVWSKEKTKGAVPPTARAGHIGVMVGEKFYIVGGENRRNEMVDTLVLDIQKREWSVVTTVHAMSPLAHDGLSVVKVQHEGRHYLMAFGGHGTLMSCQMYAMLLESATQSNPLSRSSSSSSMHSNIFSDSPRSKRRDLHSPTDPFQFLDSGSSPSLSSREQDRERMSQEKVKVKSGRNQKTSSLLERTLRMDEHVIKGMENVIKSDHITEQQDNFQLCLNSKTPASEQSFQSLCLADPEEEDFITIENTQTRGPDNKDGARFSFVKEARDLLNPDILFSRAIDQEKIAYLPDEFDTDLSQLSDTRVHGDDDSNIFRKMATGGNHAIRDQGYDDSNNSEQIITGEETHAVLRMQLSVAFKAIKELQQNQSSSSRVNKNEGELALAMLTVKELQQQVQMLRRNKDHQEQSLQKKVRNMELIASKLEVTMQQQLNTEMKLKETIQLQIDTERRLQETARLHKDAEKRLRTTMQLQEKLEKQYNLSLHKNEGSEPYFLHLSHLEDEDHLQRKNSTTSQTSYSSNNECAADLQRINELQKQVQHLEQQLEFAKIIHSEATKKEGREKINPR